MSLNLVHLRYFYDSVRLGSATAAARANFVTQPAVSQGIKSLEAYLRFPLFTHATKRLRLTPEGEEAFKHARSIFDQVNVFEQSMTVASQLGQAHVSFACSQSLGSTVLQPFLVDQAGSDDIRYSLRLGHTGLIKQWLRSADIDFGIALDNEDISALETEQLFEGKFRLFIPLEWPQHKIPESILMSQPQKETWLFHRYYEQVIGKPLKVQLQVDSWGLIASLIAQGVGCGLLPDYLARHPLYSERIRVLDIAIPDIPYALAGVWTRGESLSARAAELLLSVKRILNQSGSCNSR